MAPVDAMTPLERLLNLVGLLLEASEPLSFQRIKETIEPYDQQNVDSAKRMFERDKDTLRAFGVPIQVVDTDAWGGDQGYVIRKEEYYLPEIAFTPEELAALFVAAQSGGENDAAEAAVRKLVYGAGGGILEGLAGGPVASGSDAGAATILAAGEAAQGRRRVRFGYRTSQGHAAEREVDAFAVVYRGGHWYLVGHDREREAIRAFRLSRCTTPIADAGEGSDPPEDFRATDHVESGPWVPDPSERARVAFAPAAAWLARSQFPGAEAIATREDGWVLLSIPSADASILAPLLLGFGPDAVVEGPDDLRADVLRRLEEAVG
jgi:proteasome accessory factor B